MTKKQAPSNPLARWRMAQQVTNPRTGRRGPMTIAMAARALGVAYMTWKCWEEDLESPHFKMPHRTQMLKLYQYTKGRVTADMMHGLTPYERAA